MSTESGGDAREAPVLRAALDEAMAELPGDVGAAAPETVDPAWLGIGMRLGLERPEQARRLLALLAAEGGGAAEAPSREATAADGAEAADVADAAPRVPVRSSLLVRAAALPPAEHEGMGPGVVFGWAASLSAGEILALGQTVADLLAAGASPNVAKGFGLAWDGGVRLPQRHLESMFREFTDLEITVGGALTGRDLWTTVEPAPAPRGMGSLFGSWMPRKDPREQQAAAAVERNGEAAQRGLVALWNAWMAVRYRSIISGALFDLLVGPWITVIGPLPDA